MTILGQCRERVAAQQSADGAWGYAESGPGQVEPTSLALLALQQDQTRFRQAIERGLDCLSRMQSADGAWRVSQADDTAIWPTSLALFALSKCRGYPDSESRVSEL